MKAVKDQTIQDFLYQLASNAPAPGGGSVAAIMGASAAGLISMVCNLTIGKSQYQDVENEMRDLLQKSEALREQFTELIKNDIEAFEQVLRAYRLPKITADEQRIRGDAIQKALKIATEVPLACVRGSAEIIQLSRIAAVKGNNNVVTDAGVAVEAGLAALKSSALNIYVNIAGINDESYTQTTMAELKGILKTAKLSADEIYQIVKDRL